MYIGWMPRDADQKQIIIFNCLGDTISNSAALQLMICSCDAFGFVGSHAKTTQFHYRINFEVANLRSFKRMTRGLQPAYIIFILDDGM